MKTRSAHTPPPLWAASFVVLGFLPVLSPGLVRAADSANAELPAVPPRAFALVHIRLADIWNNAAFDEFRHLLLKAGPEALRVFDQRFVPAPSSIDQLTLVLGVPDGWIRALFSPAFRKDGSSLDHPCGRRSSGAR